MKRPWFGLGPPMLAVLASIACGGNPAAPLPTLKIISISPVSGSTTGGTPVTVIGTDFGTDATVTIGGVPATSVVVQGSTTITAVAGVREAAGGGDVVVMSGGKSATLPNAYMFVAPTGQNSPPMVTGFRSIGSRPGQPSGFADVTETVTLAASVSDRETAPELLAYAWSGPGTFTGSGATVMWQVPGSVSPTPSPVTVELTVAETFAEGGVTHRQSSSGTFVVQVHDSQSEILEAGEDFLTLFSQSNVPANQVLRGFSTTCDKGDGREAERHDVEANRANYVHDFSAFRISRRGPATIAFRGVCILPDGRVQRNVDACSSFAVHWEVTERATGARRVTNGVDYVSAALENNRWLLCHSDFIATSGFPSFGIR
jgi:hypothetical protein